MRFKEFLNETVITKWETEDQSLEQAMSTLNKHCLTGLDAVKNNGLLYRGFAKSGDGNKTFDTNNIKVIDSTNAHRTSRDSNNIYQLMMNSSESFKNFPSRSNSIICSSSLSDARDYSSDIGVIIPFDGAILAVAPVSDVFFINTESPVIENIEYNNLSDKIAAALRKFGIAVDSDGEFKDNFIDEKLKFVAPDRLVQSLIDHLPVKNKPLLAKTINDAHDDKKFTALSNLIMNAKRQGFKLSTFGKSFPAGNGPGRGCEVWFSGKCIVLSLSLFKSILAELEKENFPIHKKIKWDLGL